MQREGRLRAALIAGSPGSLPASRSEHRLRFPPRLARQELAQCADISPGGGDQGVGSFGNRAHLVEWEPRFVWHDRLDCPERGIDWTVSGLLARVLLAVDLER